MRALITGVSGFAGSHLAELLLQQGDVELFGVLWGRQNNAAHLADRMDCRWLDLTDAEATHALLREIRPDRIYHLAGQAFAPDSWGDPWATLYVNIRAQVNVMYSVTQLRLPARLLIIASAEEYGRVRPEDLPVREDTPLRPDSPYGVSKVTQDFLGLQYYISHQLYTVRLRPYNHIGPRQDSRFVAANFARQIAEIEAGLREPVIRVGNLEGQRDFTDVRDMVRAYALALEKGAPGDDYVVGSGQPRPVRDVLDGLCGWATVACRVEVDPARLRPSDTPLSYCDPGKFRRQTGWAPQIPFEQTLHDILDDARARVQAGSL